MKFDFTKEPGRWLWKRPSDRERKAYISIVTPYYNAGKYFEQTYRCVINQTFPWFEWIIVDDGSTEKESLDLLERLAGTDKRIRVIHQENRGAAGARNTGIDASATDYIYTLDADDLIEPTCLEYEFWALRFNPEAAWAYTDSIGFQDLEYVWEEPFNPEKMKKQNCLPVAALIRKDKVVEVGGYTVTGFSFNEDWHLWLKLMEKGGFPVQCKGKGDYLYWYRRTETGELGRVWKSEETRRRNQKVIDEQAAFVIAPKQPLIYPTKRIKEYEGFQASEWTEKVYQEHTKIHVLMMLPYLQMGGADKFNLDFIQGLDKDKYTISIIATKESENEWIQLFREETPEIFILPNFLAPEHYAEFVDYFIRSREIDILFLSNSAEGYYLLPWIRVNHQELVIVDYVHAYAGHWKNGGYARDSAVMGNILEKTFVCNEALARTMEEKYHRCVQNIKTVYIGVDEKYFDPARVPSGRLYEELDIETERPIVLFLCRMAPEKRPLLMVKIAEYVKQKINNVAFAVVGDGSLMKETIDRANELGLGDTVYFLGAREEVRPYYKDAKITLICSLQEGLTLTAYESCAMGIPVISADVGGQGELVNESVGVLIPLMQDEQEDFGARDFPEKEVKAYGDAIIELLLDEESRTKLSENCRKRVLEAFTIHQMTDYFNKELERLVQDNTLFEDRKHTSAVLKELGMLTEEPFLLYLAGEGNLDNTQKTSNFRGYSTSAQYEELRNRLTACEEILSRHEEVVNRHEEVVNRHEEVVNRHEDSINHQWGVQKWHEERIQALEQRGIHGKQKKS